MIQFGPAGEEVVQARDSAFPGTIGQTGPLDWPSSPEVAPDVPLTSIYKQVPSMQGYRNNLTALSQCYNVSLWAMYRIKIKHEAETF